MKRRSVILALAAVLVLSVVLPAVGAPTPSLLDIAKQADEATQTANKAQRRARKARKKANFAKKLIKSTAIVSDARPGLVTSNASLPDFEAKDGPTVKVTVPSSGLIEVWAQAEIDDNIGGSVALFEDGRIVSGGLDEFCASADALFTIEAGGFVGDFIVASTPGGFNLTAGCATPGPASPVIFQRPPGTHTYELRYSDCSCGGPPNDFRNRILRIGPRL